MSKTLRDVSVAYATKQPHQIDYVLEEAPFLAKIPFYPTTHGLQHAVEKLNNIEAAKWLKIDEPIPEVDVDSTLNYIDLGILGFNMAPGVDRLKRLRWNLAKYLAKKAPKVMKKTGAECEKSLANMYKDYARKNGNVIDAGGTSDQTRTIYAIRFVEDECCGLYDPDGFGQGALFDTMLIAGGQPYKNQKGQTVYGADFKSYIGFEMVNPECAACIVNVEDGKLTAKMMDQLLLKVRAAKGGTTYIVCNPETSLLIKEVKNARNHTPDMPCTEWNGREIIETFNFPELEDKVVLGENKMIDTSLENAGMIFEEQFFDGIAVKDNGTLESEPLNLGEGGMNSSIKIMGKFKTKGTIAGTAGSIKLEHSDTQDGTYEELDTKAIAIGTYNKNQMFYEFVLPSYFKGWAKVSITTPAGATGTVDVYPGYIPR